jgi:predicted AAA+ superfamily ATPase
MLLFGMNRDYLVKLDGWKTKKSRKPLVLNGARQVGKTYGVKLWGANTFKRTIYLNFEKDRQLSVIFQDTLDADKIIQKIQNHFNLQLDVKNDLIFFDEVQACGQALTSLKYFCEQRPDVFIIAAGSLLGLHLHSESFPVGKVDFLEIYPMTFFEFLEALNQKQLLNSFFNNYTINEFEHLQLVKYLKYFLITGGAPEVVAAFQNLDPDNYSTWETIREIQHNLLLAYMADMAKHCGKINAMHLERLLRQVPNQLAKAQNKRFQFKNVLPGKNKYSQLVDVIDWLSAAGLIYKVSVANQAQSPLSAYTKESFFKLFVFDVGLLGALADLSYQEILTYDFGTFKGYLLENFVLQELIPIFGKKIFSYSESESEVDFILQNSGRIIPIEVKSGINLRSKSLQNVIKKYQLQKALRLSLENKANKPDTKLVDFPLYVAGHGKLY